MFRLHAIVVLTALLAACGDSGMPGDDPLTVLPLPKAACAPGNEPLSITGTAGSAQLKTYLMQPFSVAPGTGRVELSYQWTEKPGNPPSNSLSNSTLDLGLWDQHGYRKAEGFRGWGGSRQGRIDQMQAPVFVQEDSADRGFMPGRIEPGTWYAELGFAAISPQGADWRLKIECKTASSNNGALPADPVDKNHVANFAPGWYHGDFHMHAYHSNPRAPDWPGFIQQARAAKLDFLMVTEYITGQHWRTLGAVQRSNPDLVIWPGREIISYFGHMNALGETPSVLDYRQGFETVKIGDIQRLSKADGALFQVNHPTIFPPPAFSNFCRGCYFELDDEIDWSQVDTLEVLTSGIVATGSDLGLAIPGSAENPFVTTAIQKWEAQLSAGHRITAVSGSDSKGVDAEAERARKGYGCAVTTVYAESLSRPALSRAIQAGHAYIRTKGALASPVVGFEVSGPNGQKGIYGDTIRLGSSEAATLTTTITGGTGQTLSYFVNGNLAITVPVATSPYVHTQMAFRSPAGEGPLGSFWRIELRDAQTRTIIGNPVFLKAP